MRKRRISQTQINMYLRCGKQWEFRYIQHISMPPSGSMMLGTAYHETVANTLRRKIKGVLLPTASEILDFYSTSWEKQLQQRMISEQNEKTEFDSIDWEGKDPGHVKDEGYTLVSLYHTRMVPDLKPINIECEVIKPLNEEVDVIGIVDLELSDRVVDHKVSSKVMSQQDADKDLQMSTYGFLTGKRNMAFHRALRKNRPDIQILPTSRTDAQVESWKFLAGRVAAAMSAGTAFPNTTGWWCSSKYCGYWDICPAVKS